MSARSEGIELNLPAATAIPLGFIVSELIANAAKYGNGRIAISLRSDPAYGYALSVSDNGPPLPEGFDPSASKGLGMKIIRSFTSQIGGELRIGQGDNGQGARFTVLFPGMATDAVAGMPNPETAATSASNHLL
jgi:two-component sensor histidine kinase